MGRGFLLVFEHFMLSFVSFCKKPSGVKKRRSGVKKHRSGVKKRNAFGGQISAPEMHRRSQHASFFPALDLKGIL